MPTVSAVIKYATNLEELRRELKAGTGELVVLEKAADRTVRVLGGEGMIRSAHNAAAAIQKLGGVSALTAKEQEKVHGQMGRVIEKMEALHRAAAKAGEPLQTIPASFRQIYNETKQLDPSISKVSGAFTNLNGVLGTFGAALSIGAVVGFTKSLLDSASQTVNLSNRLGISIEAVQRFDYVAGQTGSSVEQFANAVFKLGTNLSGGGKGIVSAVKELGLNFEELRRLSPEQQFDTIARALERMENPQDRNRIALELFGKSAAEILPAIAQGYAKIADAAPKAGEAQVRALAEASDAMDRAKSKISSIATEGLGGFILGLEKAEPKVFALAKRIEDYNATQPGLMGWLTRTAQGWRLNAEAAESYAKAFKAIPATPSLPTQPGLTGPAPGSGSLIEQALGTPAKIKASGDAVAHVTDAMRAFNEQSDRLIASREKNAKLTETTTDLLTREMRSAIDAKIATGALHDELHRGAQVWLDYQRAMTVVPLTKLPGTTIPGTGSQTPPPVIPPSLLQQIMGSGAQFGQMVAGSILSAIQGGGNVGQAAGAAIGGNVFGGLAKSLTSSIGGTAAKVTGWMGGALNAALPVLGSILGQFGGKMIEKIIGAFDRNKGRDSIEKWVKDSFGGFEGFQRRLQEVFDPETADRYWRLITQGTGRNNPEQAARNIATVEAAIKAAQQRTAEFNTKLGETLQKIRDLGGGIPDALAPLIQSLKDGKQLTAENLALLEELAAGGTVSWQALEEAAGRYGISQDKLGQEFQAAKLHEGWQQIIDDLDLFQRGGADVNGLLTDMADEISGLVQKSIKFGTDIPENMRPWIQKLIESGQLLDENGQQITDIGKLTFGETLQTSLQKLVDEVRRLIETLGGVPAAVAAIPDTVTVDVEVKYRPGELQSELPDLPEPDLSTAARGGLVTKHGVQYLGRGGSVWRPHGTDTIPAMLTPGEGVLSLRGMAMLGALNRGIEPWLASASLSGMGGAPIQAVVIMEVDGREFGRAMVPVVPGEARRLGVRVRA